jgi:hypothetical protein
MEDNGYLDSNNDHLFALHHVYLPRIQRCLSEFKAAWNDRPLGAEHNWTPQQISVNGMIHPDNSSQTAVSHILHNRTEDLELYGIDPDGPIHPEEDEL